VPVFADDEVIGSLEVKYSVPTCDIGVIPFDTSYLSFQPNLIPVLRGVFGSDGND